MKKLVTALFCVASFFSRAQNSYTVSNIPGVTANFRTLQGAIDSVAAGSTIYVFPSTTDYGNIDINKKLLIIGTGFMLDQNNAPYSNPNPEGVSISSIFFKPGSDNSYIQGLQLIGNTNENRYFRFFLDSVSNVTINRCQADIWITFPGGNIVIQTKNTSNCTFSQCYLTTINFVQVNHSGGSFYSEYGTGSQNLQFVNNIIDNRTTNGSFTMNYNGDSRRYGNVVFTNNTFVGDLNSSDFCNYSYFNNIFYNTNLAAPVNSNIGLSGITGFNITNSPGLFPANTTNYQNANPDSIFVYPSYGYHSFDQKWQLVDTSFARHFASDGGEVGAYGGYNPYVLSGIPKLPEIYSITTRRDTSIRGNILVHIKAQASY